FLPRRVDLRERNWGSIYDQGALGSCVANTVAYCIRFCMRQQNIQDNFNASRLFIYFFSRVVANAPLNQDTGTSIRDGYKSVHHHRVCDEGLWPYVIRRFAIRPSERALQGARQFTRFQYLAVAQNELEIKKCLKDGFPISFGAMIFTSFMSLQASRTGVIPMPGSDRQVGGHAMTIVGYDDAKRHFIVCNSWSQKWGDGGFCYMPYAYILDSKLCSDFWSVR
ncbi:hypothetical protein BCR44DRAFT_100395, partial [Catenaria anguillulae PL171]